MNLSDLRNRATQRLQDAYKQAQPLAEQGVDIAAERAHQLAELAKPHRDKLRKVPVVGARVDALLDDASTKLEQRHEAKLAEASGVTLQKKTHVPPPSKPTGSTGSLAKESVKRRQRAAAGVKKAKPTVKEAATAVRQRKVDARSELEATDLGDTADTGKIRATTRKKAARKTT